MHEAADSAATGRALLCCEAKLYRIWTLDMEVAVISETGTAQ
jgi:hypothetical protein